MSVSSSPTLKYVDETLETLAPGDLRALQWSKLSALLSRVWHNNAYFRSRWQDAGIKLDQINSLDDFAAVMPLVEKADFIADQESSPPYGRRHEPILKSGSGHVPITTSGSSGQGVELHLQSQDDVANHNAINHYYFRWAGLNPGDNVFLTMHVSLLAGGRCEYHAALDYGLSVYPVAMYDTRQRLDLMRRFRPSALFATTSYLGHLAGTAGEDLTDAGVEVLLCGAESANFKWFERLENAYGARAFDRYGVSQMGTDFMFSCEYGVGDQTAPGVLHNIDPFVLLEVVDTDTGQHVGHGERSEIVVTSLYRHMAPMIRCRTRDSAIYYAPGSCRCGRGFSGLEIGSVQRIDDVKKVKGINIWPQAMDETMFSFSEVSDYRVTLMSDATEADIALVEYVPILPLADDDTKSLSNRIVDHLRQRIGIGFLVQQAETAFEEIASQKARRWVDNRHHIVTAAHAKSEGRQA